MPPNCKGTCTKQPKAGGRIDHRIWNSCDHCHKLWAKWIHQCPCCHGTLRHNNRSKKNIELARI